MKIQKIVIISKSPKMGLLHDHDTGVSSYTRNFSESLEKVFPGEIIILANRESGSSRLTRKGRITVLRAWRETPFFPARLLFAIRKLKPDVIHLHHELFLYGGSLSNVLFLLLLLSLRVLNLKVIVTLHGVPSKAEIDESFVLSNGLAGHPGTYRAGLQYLIASILALSQAVIVHEEFLKTRLSLEYSCRLENVVVIHHGIEDRVPAIDKETARLKLGIDSDTFLLLFLGYWAPYKDVDKLLDAFRSLHPRYPNWRLIVASGPHPRLGTLSTYKKSYEDFRGRVKSVPGAIFVGFVEEGLMWCLLKASDLAVFPYRSVMHASGPVSLCLAAETPFMVSENARGSMPDEIFYFPLDSLGLARCIERFAKDKQIRSKILSCIMAKKSDSSWRTIARKTLRIYESVAEGKCHGTDENTGSPLWIK